MIEYVSDGKNGIQYGLKSVEEVRNTGKVVQKIQESGPLSQSSPASPSSNILLLPYEEKGEKIRIVVSPYLHVKNIENC